MANEDLARDRRTGVADQRSAAIGAPLEVLLAFLRLGLMSFGGPVAHLGYFRQEFVVRRHWLSDAAYADLVALCQFLPGPASSQVGMAIGLSRAGYPGALAAWTGFTAPSAILLVIFAYSLATLGQASGLAWIHGLKVAAVAVVAQAVLGMMRSLAPDRIRASIAVAAACLALLAPSTVGQLGAIVFGGFAGLCLPGNEAAIPKADALSPRMSRTAGAAFLALFFILLLGLPLLALTTHDHAIELFTAFYRAGSLVFGGGHVVLPLLQALVVPPGWIGNDAFLAGYGAAQAVPGPLFTFSAYLGAAMLEPPNRWVGAILCLVAIFLPSFLLLLGALPFWEGLRRNPQVRAALRGVNASVVGLLLAALYNPVWAAGISNAKDFALAAVAFLLLFMWQTPPWLVVVLSAIAGAVMATV